MVLAGFALPPAAQVAHLTVSSLLLGALTALALVAWRWPAPSRDIVTGRRAGRMIVSDPLFVAYLSFTFVFVATPGATTAVVVRNALDGGRRAGLFAALGAACANATHATVAGLGGAALLRVWPGALDAVRLAGGGYLAYLGARSLWLAYLGHAPLVMAVHRSRARPTTGAGAKASWSTCSGPVILTFYLTVVPTFIRPSWPRGAYVVLAACHVAMAFACHSAWVLALHRMRAAVRRVPVPVACSGRPPASALLLLAARVLRWSAAT